ncbi:response regulator [Oligoflexus tunisiensis]|uniref:response regulator n=1 Tax=Oligoflexus tunisiensis TaxID=708132 RepID=UPI00114CDCE1|nr:response regulator [Oligoflexus tunisiensis]
MFSKPYLMVIVDDERDLAGVLAEYLEDMFPGVFAAHFFNEPEGAINFVETNPVRVVVTEVRMPGMDGDQINLRVKQMGRGIKTVIITGNLSYTKALTCYNDGADAFIQKPFNPSEIRSTFQRVLDCIESWEDVLRNIAHEKVS